MFWKHPDVTTQFTNIPKLSSPVSVPSGFVLATPSSVHNWGPFGVAIFFLVSGFVIPFSFSKQTTRGFLVSRIFRIVPTYAIGFCFTIAIVMLACTFFQVEPPFNRMETLIHMLPGIRDLLGSRNIDTIIWTLEIEVKFYLFYAICRACLGESANKVIIPALVLGMVGLMICKYIQFVPPRLAKVVQLYLFNVPFLLYIFVGVVLHGQFRNQMTFLRSMFSCAVLLCLSALLWGSGPYATTLGQFWNYIFAFLVFTCAMSFPKLVPSNRILDFFADISYPLYVVHGIAGYSLMRVLQEFKLSPYLLVAIAFVVAVFVSWTIHVFVEKPTQSIGKTLAKRWFAPRGNAMPL